MSEPEAVVPQVPERWREYYDQTATLGRKAIEELGTAEATLPVMELRSRSAEAGWNMAEARIRELEADNFNLLQQDRIKTREINLAVEGYRNQGATVAQQTATIAELTKERDEYKFMYEGLCK